MLQIRPIVRAIAILCAGGAHLYATGQEATVATARVEVTGSRIKRVDAETASAVQVITREEILRSGALTVTDVLRGIPAGNTGGYTTEGTPGQAFGGAGISLRGLGAGSTLTLINGRRAAPFGFGSESFVDTNSIPVEAIERIETLLDGASAIYGADAIGGVINIILRKNYEGLSFNATGGATSYHDAKSKGFGLNYGKGSLADDGYNFLVSLNHHETDPVLANARPRTKDADFRRFNLSDRRSTYSRNLYTASGYYGGSFVGTLAGCTPVDDATSNLNGRCVNDNTGSVNLVSKYNSDTLYSAGSYALGGGAELFGDLSLARTKYGSNTYSYGTDSYAAYTYDLVDKHGSFGNPPGGKIAYLVLPVGHPQNPLTDKPVGVRYLFNDIRNTVNSESNNQRVTFGARGEVKGWDAEIAGMYSRSRTSTRFHGYIQDAVLTGEVLDADGLVKNSFLLGQPDANDQGLMSRLYPRLVNEARTSTATIDVRASRELFKLPAGPLAVAVGAEFRRESFTATPDPLFSSGAIQLFTITGSTGTRTVGALYGEMVAPLFKSLELNLAARTDHYNDFGSAVTPKVGLKWEAAPQLAFRGTLSHGFRAPSLPEMNSGTTAGYMKVLDPKLCPVFSDTNGNCERYVAYVSGQNPDLKAEKSKSLTVGMVFEPIPRWSLAVDAYDIKRRNEISTISSKYLLDHEAQYSNLITRSAITDQIDKLSLLSLNLAETKVRGVDFDARGRTSLGRFGTLSLSGSYNRMISYKTAEVPNGDLTEYAGYYDLPKNRAKAGLVWDMGNWQSSLNWNFTGSYSQKSTPDTVCSFEAKNPSYCTIKSWLTADAYLGYRGFTNWDLSLSVQNLANKEAPFDAGRLPYLLGYNSSYHNQMGRNIQLSAKYTFK